MYSIRLNKPELLCPIHVTITGLKDDALIRNTTSSTLLTYLGSQILTPYNLLQVSSTRTACTCRVRNATSNSAGPGAVRHTAGCTVPGTRPSTPTMCAVPTISMPGKISWGLWEKLNNTWMVLEMIVLSRDLCVEYLWNAYVYFCTAFLYEGVLCYYFTQSQSQCQKYLFQLNHKKYFWEINS